MRYFSHFTALHPVGEPISGGDIFGTCYENELMTVHKIMCPPNINGRVVKVYGNGGDGHDKFTLSDTVLEVENASGKIIKLGEDF